MSEGRDDDRVTIATALAEIKQLKTEVERIGRELLKSVSQRCMESGFQDCGQCQNAQCGDNRTPGIVALIRSNERLKDEWGPEETQVLRGDADNILLHSAADAIERRDVEIKQLEAENQRLKDSSAKAEAHIKSVRAERDRLLERDMRLCVLINENTPPGAQPCTVDMLEGAVKWLCWELHRLLTLAREFKAELYGAGGRRERT